jgi:hypothetical protein
MSDEEEEYEYSDEGEEEDDDMEIEIENAYYEGDEYKSSDPKRAISMFEKVVELEQGDEIKWRFKSLEHLVVLQFRLGNTEAMIERYLQMLEYIANSAVTRNDCTNSINT